MARLSSKERELLKLKYLDEWSINEIAVRQHKRPSSIKMQLYRARKKLRKVMAENDE
jgi:RNA polymerase sigma-70 factor (ECF subfamily)